MAKFVVNYSVVCSGEVTVEAKSEDQARSLVEEMNSSDLGREADSRDLDITLVERI
jgi:hypothetical protein